MKFIAIIPARWASSRFPGKPLAKLGGMTMIERVYRQASLAIDNVLVATDDCRIADEVNRFGGSVVMTSPDHRSGTDRVNEAYKINGGNEDVIINVQGDEPFVAPEQILSLTECFDDAGCDIATLVKPVAPGSDIQSIENPNKVKVVVDKNNCALYFSRSVVPYLRGVERDEWTSRHRFFTHLGMYGYRSNVLDAITRMPASSLEVAESLEQLRWLENGFRIKVGVTELSSIGIDTPQDLQRAEQWLKTNETR